MKERPIIFTENIPAILDGRKTQTRRVIKPQPITVDDERQRVWYQKVFYNKDGYSLETGESSPAFITGEWKSCPYGQVGDRLWVREKFAYCAVGDNTEGILCLADNTRIDHTFPPNRMAIGIHPSIHMPRWASRITLEITEVRVERLQEITNNDAKAEGAPCHTILPDGRSLGSTHRYFFKELWDSLNAKRKVDITTNLKTVYPYSWTANPWVWVICFRKLE